MESSNAAPLSRGLYTIVNRPHIPRIDLLNPTLGYCGPITPDPSSSDEEFDSSMPTNDQLPLPEASSLPHPVTVYFCCVGRAINGHRYIGYHSNVLPITDHFRPHEFNHMTCWFNWGSGWWEALPKGYTTNPPPASYTLEQAEEWWEEAEEIIQLTIELKKIDHQAGSSQAHQSSDTQGRVEEGPSTQARQIIQDSPQPHGDTVDQADMVSIHEEEGVKQGYVSESTLTPSDYSESRKAELIRCEQACKNWGLGHNLMNMEEEADDEMMMEEVDRQERLCQGRRTSKKASPDSDNPREKKGCG